MKVEKGSGRDVVGCAVKLCDKICVTAHDSVATLWSAFLEVGDWTWCRPRRRPCGSW